MTGLDEWTRVVIRVPAAAAELAADRLWRFAPAAIEEQVHGSDTVLLAGFDDTTRAAAALAAIRADGLGDGDLHAVDDDGLDGWRNWARAERAGPFVIVPAWLEAPEPRPGTHLLRIDPERTFGSGSHPTSRLVLALLPDLVTPTSTVLDVGCGSGILAIGAALLGAHECRGIDIDPATPEVVTANATRNGVEGRVVATCDPLPAVVAGELATTPVHHDLVIANLLAPIVVELAPHLVRAVAPGGRLVVSGLLADRWRASTDHLGGLAVVDVAADEGWVAVTLEGSPQRR